MAETPNTREEVLAELEVQSMAAGPVVFKAREFHHALAPEQRRHGVGGNGAPALDEPEKRPLRLGAAEAVRLGGAMYGRRWKEEVAGDTGEHSREVRRWAAGESAPSRASLQRLLNAARRKRDREDAAIAALEAYLDAPPRMPPAEPEVDVAAGIRAADAAFFLNGITKATGGVPTPLRAILSVKVNPRARIWTAEVTIFDGTQHTLECDRGDDRTATVVWWAEGPRPERRELRILWDEETEVWKREPDLLNGTPMYVPPPRAEDDPAFVPQPFNPIRPRGRLGSPRRAEAARNPQGRLL